MTTLAKNKINSLARVLKHESNVDFKHNGFFYEIFESACKGYVVNVYKSAEKDEDGEYIEANLIDGGLCIGTATDAIGFL